MRYLNKVIFLNSAHIPYAEIRVDGNVHFIGTQGVGKSTLLRAILFFYNADKLHLGIPKEKQNFDACASCGSTHKIEFAQQIHNSRGRVPREKHISRSERRAKRGAERSAIPFV